MTSKLKGSVNEELPKAKYGINLILHSTKLSQCQEIIGNAHSHLQTQRLVPFAEVQSFGHRLSLVPMLNMTNTRTQNKS